MSRTDKKDFLYVAVIAVIVIFLLMFLTPLRKAHAAGPGAHTTATQVITIVVDVIDEFNLSQVVMQKQGKLYYVAAGTWGMTTNSLAARAVTCQLDSVPAGIALRMRMTSPRGAVGGHGFRYRPPE